MRPSRGVLFVRLAVYAILVVIGLIVWQLRANPEAARPSAGREVLHGEMLDPFAGRASVVLRDGEVSEVVVNLAVICPGDGRPAEMRFEDTGNSFGRDARRFSASRSVDYLVEADGWQPRVTVAIDGEITKNGRAVRGTATSSVAWRRNGVAGATCGPKVVRWEALRTADT
jgi:hypothetical protein